MIRFPIFKCYIFSSMETFLYSLFSFIKMEEYNENNLEEDVYNEEGRESAVEDDEISAEEDGFMKGYDEDYEEDKKEDTNEE